MFVEFLKNTSIPLELRTAVSQRIQSLLVEDLPQLERVQQYDASILQQSLNPVGKLGQAVYVGFLEQKEMFSLIWAARNLTVSHEESQSKQQKLIMMCCVRRRTEKEKPPVLETIFILKMTIMSVLWKSQATWIGIAALGAI